MPPLYYEDLAPGFAYTTGTATLTEETITRFGKAFDPQPFHTDPAVAPSTFFGGLVASGWHTACETMRLMVEGRAIAGGWIGLGVDAIRWPRPTRPGDRISVRVEVLERRPSSTRPDRGIVIFGLTTSNQNNETVMTLRTSVWAPLRLTN